MSAIGKVIVVLLIILGLLPIEEPRAKGRSPTRSARELEQDKPPSREAFFCAGLSTVPNPGRGTR